jgi:hypothetical protein
MRDKTLGEVAGGLARYKAQLLPLLVVLVVALFFEGAGQPAALDSAAAPVAAGGAAPQVGSASVPPALAGPTGGVADFVLPDLSASGDSGGATPTNDSSGQDDGPAPEPPGLQPFTCEQDASLPMPVIAPVMEQIRANLPPEIASYIAGAAMCSPGTDPLTLVVAQLAPVLVAAGPVIDAVRPINSMLPPLPLPPPVPIPGFPPELNPVLAAAYPVTSEACGQLAISVILIAVLANFPTPITGQHVNAIISPIFGLCSSLTGPGVPPSS